MVTTAEAAHLLRRTGFGERRLLTGESAASDPWRIIHLTALSRQQAVDYVMGQAPPAVAYPAPSVEGDWLDWVNTTRWWVDRMITTPAPLVEKMILFWHSHFACSFEKVGDWPAMRNQFDLFRTHALGHFPTLLTQVSLGSAMLVALDNESNVASGIQENFARELMELYTIGVGNFTEADVVAMARAWTGYNVVGWNGVFYDIDFEFHSEDHDHGQKTLFGITGNWDGTGLAGGNSTITELCTGARGLLTARFIARKLFKYFIHITPSDAAVNQLADSFIAANWDIGVLVEAVLMRDEFWDAASRYQLVKNPIEFVVSALRRTRIASSEHVHYQLSEMGMAPFDPPSVAGWPQNGFWISTANSWARGAFAGHLGWRADDYGFFDGLSAGTATQGSATTAVNRMFDDFGVNEPSAATRTRFEAWWLTSRQQYSWSIQPYGVVLGALSPDFQVA